MIDIKNKTVLITGGSGDIGRAICLAFANEGANIAVHYNRNKEAAEKLCDEINKLGVKAQAFQCDIKNETEVDRMVGEIESSLGAVDILVNNAGAALIKLFDEITLDEWNELIGINLTGTFLVTKRCMRNFLHNKEGSIINIASMWGQVGASCETAYSASKGAVIALTKALAKEVGLSGIRVNCISPGLINTRMNAHLSEEEINGVIEEIPLNVIGRPEDVAESCVFLAKSEFITGQIIGVNGGQVV